MSVSSRRFAWTVRVFLFVTALGGILFATGCGNVSSMGTVPISVTITNKVTTALTNNGTFTFNATVRNDPANKGVTWTLTEIDGTTCPSGCGAISNATSTSVTYTPPNSLFGGVFDTPIVVATSASDPTKFDQDNVTLIATTVTITNKVKAVQAGTGAITLHAVVANDPVGNGVTSWFLADTLGVCTPANPVCGSLSNATTTSVVYTPPASVPGVQSNNPFISASSSPRNGIGYGDLDSFNIISAAPSNCAGTPTGHESRLSGQYAFFAQGGALIAASFAPDGSGKITDLGGGIGGALDLNTTNGALSSAIMSTGSLYQVGADPTGAGDLGCLQAATSDGSTTIFRFSLAAPVSGITSRGKLIEYDDQSGNGTGTRLTGMLLKQDPAAFASGNTSKLHANYSFGVDGGDPNRGHLAAAGRLTLDPTNGLITNSVFDEDDAGILETGILGGTGSITAVSPKTGRALFSFTAPSSSLLSPSANPTHAAIYIVNADEFFLANLDPIVDNGVTLAPGATYSGRAIVSGTSFTAPAGNFIVHLTGNVATCGCASATLGLVTLTPTGATGGSTAGTLREYNLQKGATSVSLSGGTYAVDLSTRRVTLSASGATTPLLVLYISAPATDTENIPAFALGTDTNGAFGLVEPGVSQSITTSSLAGSYFFGDEDPGDGTITDRVGVVAVSTAGVITGTEDDSGPTGLVTKAASGMVTIDNASGFGTGNVGANTVAITNGTKLFFIDETSGGPASIRVVEHQ